MISGALEVRYDHPARFHAYERNARIHDDTQRDQIVASIEQFGFVNPILVDEGDEIIAGHGRQGAALHMGLETIPYIVLAGLSSTQKRALRVADNKISLNSSWDYGLLAAELSDLQGLETLTGFAVGELEALYAGNPQPEGGGPGGGGGGAEAEDTRPPPSPEEARQTLAERFGLVPFTVFNAREGWWQDRKRAWIGLGLQSELGRGDALLGYSYAANHPDFYERKAAYEAEVGHEVSYQEFRAVYEGKPVEGLKGNGWHGGVARRDPAFYAKKREWEAANGRSIDTTEFREKYWDGGQ